MRILCLYFPRLGIQLVQRARPLDRPIVLLDGEGGDARAVAASTADVPPGVTAGQARQRCPQALFLPDNAAACYDELDRLTGILHANATPLVAIGGPDHLFVDLHGLGRRFGDEPATARRLAGMAQAWSGLDVRAGVAGSRVEALAAARAARQGPLCVRFAGPRPATEQPVVDTRGETLAADVRLARGDAPSRRWQALERTLSRLAALSLGRGEVPRAIAVRIDGAGPATWYRGRPGQPLRSVEALSAALGALFPASALDGAAAVRIELSTLVPVPPDAVAGSAARAIRQRPPRARQPMLAAG